MAQQKRAEQFRNGLMIALLTVCPIWARNLAGLVTGAHLIKVIGNWPIKLSARETEERRPDARALPDLLKPPINRYLYHHRPRFGHDGKGSCVGCHGEAMKPYSVIYNVGAGNSGIARVEGKGPPPPGPARRPRRHRR